MVMKQLNIDGSCSITGNIGFRDLIRDNKGDWIAGFSSSEGEMCFLLSYLGFIMV